MSDDPYFLASAYLDGELSADEWARAAVDPEVMAIVERMQVLAGELADVEPPSTHVRERAIAAALDELPALVPVRAGRSPVVTWLGLAAAAVAVLAVGAVVINGVRGGGDDGDVDLAGGEIAQMDATIEPPTLEAAADVLAESAGADATAFEAEAAIEDAADQRMGDETLIAATADDGDIADGGGSAPTALPAPAYDVSEPIASPEDLSAYGLHLLEREATGDLPPTPNTHCPAPDQVGVVEVLGEASYLRDGTAVPVLVAIDRTTGVTLALDPVSCDVVADNRLP